MLDTIATMVIRETACPVCKVPKGIYCSTRGGRQLKSPHLARINLHCIQGSIRCTKAKEQIKRVD